MDDTVLIRKLISSDEGPSLDFKSTPIRLDTEYHKAKVIKNIISMANTLREGSAYIISGIVPKQDGTKDIIGVGEHPDDANLQTLVSGKVNPIPRFHYRSVSYQGKSLGILEVFPRRGGPFIPDTEFAGILRRNVIYFRRGSSNDVAKAEDLREIMGWMEGETEGNKPIQAKWGKKSSISIGGAWLPLPCFFPSISSVKTNLKPVEYLQVLSAVGHPLFLVSAYDIHRCLNQRDRKRMEALLQDAARNQKAVVLDSGTYESFWHQDRAWKVRDFWKCLQGVDYGFAFHFDEREQRKAQASVQLAINEIEGGVLRDQEKTSHGTIIPIVHAREELFPEVVRGVAERLAPVMIAMPERELGQGILARAQMICKIRLTLNQTGTYYPIHLLGTGNPLSILIYTLSGADSFDGLEWCQTAVDHNTGLLYHFQQREFFGEQSQFGVTPGIPYIQATLAHNLLFYRKWMEQIQSATSSSTLEEFAQTCVPKVFLGILRERLKETQ